MLFVLATSCVSFISLCLSVHFLWYANEIRSADLLHGHGWAIHDLLKVTSIETFCSIIMIMQLTMHVCMPCSQSQANQISMGWDVRHGGMFIIPCSDSYRATLCIK